ncbi:MAG: hypothetical protein ACI9UA_003521 [Pseudoalteromonas tetraodonis]|jgi:hypothetical protein
MPDEFLKFLDASHDFARPDPVLAISPPMIRGAEAEEIVVGFCRFRPSQEDDVPAHTSQIFALNVEPTRWRHGVGQTLMVDDTTGWRGGGLSLALGGIKVLGFGRLQSQEKPTRNATNDVYESNHEIPPCAHNRLRAAC